MAEVAVTYETLFELLRKERQKREVQELDSNFFQNVLNYLNEKQKILESQKTKDSIFSKEVEKTVKQLQNTRKILMDLYERRESKIVDSALTNSRLKEKTLPPLLLEEKEFYNEMLQVLNKYRKSILYSLLSNQLPKIAKEERPHKTKILVRFTKAVPKFVAPDLNTYGPFEEEDILNIDSNIARVLIQKKRAKEINA